MEVNDYIKKLKKILDSLVQSDKYEHALVTAKILSNIYYDNNQIYIDSDLEDVLIKIRNIILKKEKYTTDEKCVMFYDGFGLNLRGWAASYVRALSSIGYYVIYLCPIASKGKIPHIVSELDKDKSKIIYLDNKLNNTDRAKKIDAIFKIYKPITAFFYTTPSDVSAAIAFSNNNSTTRFQIDLTDHAYWVGVNAFDYILESREMGASLAIYERGIAMDKIIKLDCVPYINKDMYDATLPLDIYNDKYIFTGGSLYKTLGDKDLLYYKTISYILENFKDIKFLYAGQGDDSEMKKLISAYSGRAFLINERPDFFELIKNSILYVNSYPMFGGLMMRYAALAHKVPITLRHDNDADGILLNQEKLGIEFDNYKDYLDEINKLLSNEDYRKKKEISVYNSVMTETDFNLNLELLIKEHKTKYSFDDIPRFDTSKFRSEYKNRYSKKTLYKTIASLSNKYLIKYFPKEFIYGLLLKIKERLYI